MKIIIGIILIYIILVVSSASLMKFVWTGYKGTELEENLEEITKSICYWLSHYWNNSNNDFFNISLLFLITKYNNKYNNKYKKS